MMNQIWKFMSCRFCDEMGLALNSPQALGRAFAQIISDSMRDWCEACACVIQISVVK